MSFDLHGRLASDFRGVGKVYNIETITNLLVKLCHACVGLLNIPYPIEHIISYQVLNVVCSPFHFKQNRMVTCKKAIIFSVFLVHGISIKC